MSKTPEPARRDIMGRVPVIVNAAFGGAGIFGKPEVLSTLRSLAAGAKESRARYRQGEDFLLDVHVLVSGDVWQHGRSGIQLGNIGRKGRSLWVKIYMPDEITTREQGSTVPRWRSARGCRTGAKPPSSPRTRLASRRSRSRTCRPRRHIGPYVGLTDAQRQGRSVGGMSERRRCPAGTYIHAR
jgi:hypothetical protein